MSAEDGRNDDSAKATEQKGFDTRVGKMNWTHKPSASKMMKRPEVRKTSERRSMGGR